MSGSYIGGKCKIMKVLFVQKEGGIFGAEQFHLKTIPFLMKSGIEVEFLRLYTKYQLGVDSPFVEKLKSLGVVVYQVDIGTISKYNCLKQMRRIVLAGNYDIVHSHLVHADFYCALLKNFFIKDLVLISTKHGYEEAFINEFGLDSNFRKRNLYYWINRYSESVSTASFAISEGLKRFFIESGISKPEKMSTIHYGFNMPEIEITPDFDKTQYRISKVQLVLAGRLVGFKGHRYALEALKILKEKYPAIKLLIIGIGELEAELKSKVTELGIQDNVVFLGYKPDVSAYMYFSDVVLVPSVAEGFGVVFLEAISNLKPVAAFDVCAGNEIFDTSYKNFLAKPFDVNDYADKIDYMLTKKHDLDIPLAKSNDRMKTYFSIERMINDIIKFYQKVVDSCVA